MNRSEDNTIMQLLLARFDGVDRGIEEVKTIITNHIEDDRAVEHRLDIAEGDIRFAKWAWGGVTAAGAAVVGYFGWK